MGIDEDVATTVLSVFTGLVIGSSAESLMPSANADASVGELMFETAVQAALLVVMFRVLVDFDDLRASGAVPFGMAVLSAQPGLMKKLSVLAVEAAKVRREVSRQMVGLVPVVPKANQEQRPS
jgi:hypothetical protein